ncbi:MAG: hypothetical protein LBV55_04030 [Acholeplasmatales bacterium]|jgi:hypothetical protein|nr:hypothetical protein [Acholeplasmatales bacterium]
MGINIFEEIKEKLHKNLESRKISLNETITNMSNYLDDLDSQISSYYNLYRNQQISADSIIESLKKRKAIFINNNENQLRIINEKKVLVDLDLSKQQTEEFQTLQEQLNKKNIEINNNYASIFEEIEKNNTFNDIVYTRSLRSIDNDKKYYEIYYAKTINKLNDRYSSHIDRLKNYVVIFRNKLEEEAKKELEVYEEQNLTIQKSVAFNINHLNEQSKLINDNYLKYSSNTNNLLLIKNEEISEEIKEEKLNFQTHQNYLQEQALRYSNAFNDTHKEVSYNYTIKINEINSVHYRLIDENNKKISDIQRKIKELSFSEKVNESSILRLNNAIKRINAYKTELNRKYNIELNYNNNLRTYLTKKNSLQYNCHSSVINQSISILDNDLKMGIKKKTLSYSYSLVPIDYCKSFFNDNLNVDFNIISNRSLIAQIDGEIYKRKLDFDHYTSLINNDNKLQILDLKCKYYIEKMLLIKKMKLDRIYIEKKMRKNYFEDYLKYYQVLGESKKEQNLFELRLYANNRSFLKKKAQKDYNDQTSIALLNYQAEVDSNHISSMSNFLSTIVFTFKNDHKIKQKFIDELCEKYQVLLNNTTNFAKYYIEFFIYNLLTIKELIAKAINIIPLKRILNLACEVSNLINSRFLEILNDTINYINNNFLVDSIKAHTTYYGYITSLLDINVITDDLYKNIEQKMEEFSSISQSNLDNEDYDKARHLYEENKKTISDLKEINFEDLEDLNTIDYSVINNLKENIISLAQVNVTSIIEGERLSFEEAYSLRNLNGKSLLDIIEEKTKHLYELFQSLSTIESFMEADITSMKKYASTMYEEINEKYIHVVDNYQNTLKYFEENTTIFNDLLISLRSNIAVKSNKDQELDHEKKLKLLIESNSSKQSASKLSVETYFKRLNDHNQHVIDSNKLIDDNYQDSLHTIKIDLETRVNKLNLIAYNKIVDAQKVMNSKIKSFEEQIEKNNRKIDYFVRRRLDLIASNRKNISKKKRSLFKQYLQIQRKQASAKKNLKYFKNSKDQLFLKQINKLKKSLKITRETF